MKKIAGEDWLKGFRKRMGDLSLRKPESTSLARAMAFNPFSVHAFFDNLKSILSNSNIPPTRIWNLDEIGINTVSNSRHILCRTGTKQVGQIRSGERGLNITMCFCVCAAEMALPPALTRRTDDQHGLGSKPTCVILLCPWERHFTALSPAWWS